MYDRLLAWYCRLSVCPSVRLPVCLFVTKCIMALMFGVGGWKLYRCLPRRALPINFFRHFCCAMYCSATAHSEKPNRQNSLVWNSYGQRSHVTMAIPDSAFSAVLFCSYTVRRIQYDRLSCSNSCASCYFEFLRLYHVCLEYAFTAFDEVVYPHIFTACMVMSDCEEDVSSWWITSGSTTPCWFWSHSTASRWRWKGQTFLRIVQ